MPFRKQWSLVLFILDYLYRWLRQQCRRVCIGIIRQGRMPRHIAFIMDGNRRYAVRHNLASKMLGHVEGYKKLEEILEWCFKLEIRTITVYAFSLENFKRPQEEIDTLMELAIEKFEAMARHSNLIRKNEVAIRVLGELQLLPESVREAANSAMHLTRNYRQFTINICFPYTSQAEMLAASNRFLKDVHEGTASPGNLDVAGFGRRLYTAHSPPVDVLVRTSGERRLSEFLLWQVTERPCQIEILNVLWPELGMRHLIPVLLRFQTIWCHRQDKHDRFKVL